MTDDKSPALPRVRQLTAKEEIFAQSAVTMSYADAYRIAYNTDGPNDTSRSGWADPSAIAWRPHVQQRIIELTAAAAKKITVDREWLLQWWYLRLIYDPAELTRWAMGACRHCHGDGHGYQWREHEYLDRLAKAELAGASLPDIAGGLGYNAQRDPDPDCPQCDGRGVGRADLSDTRSLTPAGRAAFEGIEQTRDGIKIKMADKVKAAEAFAKLSGFDVVQVRHFVDELPQDAVLAARVRDPDAIAATYRRYFGASLSASTRTAGRA